MAMRAGLSATSRPHVSGVDVSQGHGRQSPASVKSRLTFAEGAVLLVAVYALTGTGIGAVAGSAATGAIVGMTVGLFAAVAILLVSGASASSCAEGRARAAVTNLQDHRRWPPIVRQRSEVTTAVDR